MDVCLLYSARSDHLLLCSTIWLGNVGNQIANYILRHLISHVLIDDRWKVLEYGHWPGPEIRRTGSGTTGSTNHKTIGPLRPSVSQDEVLLRV